MPIFTVYSDSSKTILEADSADKALTYIQGLAGPVITMKVRIATEKDLEQAKNCDIKIPKMPFPPKKKKEEVEEVNDKPKFSAVQNKPKSATG